MKNADCFRNRVGWLAVWVAGALGAQEPLATDRPDATESPHPVPVGRWQVETDVLAYQRDGSDPSVPGQRTRRWDWGVTNLKYGLAEDLDVQLVLEPFSREAVRAADGSRSTIEGMGDLTLRLKWRFHDAGAAGAWAVLPYLKLPTADDGLGNGAVEGGFVVPFGKDLSDRWSFGFQTGVEWRRLEPADGGSYGAVPMATAVFGQRLTESVGLFYEVAAAVNPAADSDPWEVTLNTGGTYLIGALRQLDLAVMIGVTRSAPDLTLLAGYSQRW